MLGTKLPKYLEMAQGHISLSQLMFPQACQYNPQMLSMLLFIFGIYQDIVDEDHHELVQLGHEHRVHQISEVSRSILSPKDMTR